MQSVVSLELVGVEAISWHALSPAAARSLAISWRCAVAGGAQRPHGERLLHALLVCIFVTLKKALRLALRNGANGQLRSSFNPVHWPLQRQRAAELLGLGLGLGFGTYG